MCIILLIIREAHTSKPKSILVLIEQRTSSERRIPKMRILCLHGTGNNSEIMKRKISQVLQYSDLRWELYYPQGNKECPPAPGDFCTRGIHYYINQKLIITRA